MNANKSKMFKILYKLFQSNFLMQSMMIQNVMKISSKAMAAEATETTTETTVFVRHKRTQCAHTKGMYVYILPIVQTNEANVNETA